MRGRETASQEDRQVRKRVRRGKKMGVVREGSKRAQVRAVSDSTDRRCSSGKCSSSVWE